MTTTNAAPATIANSGPDDRVPRTADVLVVGGGAAGLAAAVALGRSRRDVLVVDAGEQRNLPSHAAHNLLGREGVDPAMLAAEGRREARSYGVYVVDGTVTGAVRTERGFAVSIHTDDAAGGTAASAITVRARRLVLATGLLDVLPDIPGLADGWGETVLHCPYCHGWEVRDRRIGVIASDGATAVHQALLFTQLSDDVTVYPNGVDVAVGARADLAVMGVRVVDGTVDRVDAGRSIVIDGVAHPADAIVVAPHPEPRTGLYESLGGVLEDSPLGPAVPADPSGRTAVAGVWVAGNAVDRRAMVAAAAAAGVTAGAAVNADLVAEDLATAHAAGTGDGAANGE